MPAELTTIRLHGPLGARFGSRHRLAVNSPREAIRALDVRTKGAFGAYLREHSEPGYCIRIGTHSQDLEGLSMRCTGKTVSIIPVVQGNKDGFDRILAGIAIIVISYYTMGAGTAAWGGTAWGAGASAGYGIGMSCILGGVSQLIAGTPQAPGPNDKESNRASYLFNGTVNTLAQGNPVPILYGKLRVGGCVISGGINVQDHAAAIEDSGDAIGYSQKIQFGDGTFNLVQNASSGTFVNVWVKGVAHSLIIDHFDAVLASVYKKITGTNGYIVLADNCTALATDGSSWVACSALRVGDSIYGLGQITAIEIAEKQYNAMGSEMPIGGVVNISDGGTLNSIDEATKDAFQAGKCGLICESGAIIPCVLCASSNHNDYPPDPQS